MVRAVDAKGVPIPATVTLKNPDGAATPAELAKRAEGWQGVVYVGKAVHLRNRFGLLVNSWSSNPPGKPHDSRKTWNEKDVNFQAQYPADRMQVRFKRMSSKDWSKNTLRAAFGPYVAAQAGKPGWPYATDDDALADIDAWFKEHYPHWTKLHGNDQSDMNVEATVVQEQWEMKKVRDCFGSFPVLNKDMPE